MKKAFYLHLIVFALQGISNVHSKSLLNQKAVLPQQKSDMHINVSSLSDIVEPLISTVVSIYAVDTNIGISLNNKVSKYQQEVFLGSGVIIDSSGYIVTNENVIAGAENIKVKLHDGSELIAELVGSDNKINIALLKINSSAALSYATFGDSNQSRVGDQVIAIGSPFGLRGTVTNGIISSKGRDMGNGIVTDFIQTNAAIHMGSFGGPMFNLEGKIIGINSIHVSYSGISFAIPSNTVLEAVECLKKGEKIRRGMLNVMLNELTPELNENLGLKKDQNGVLITEVIKEGSAAQCGIAPGDVITKFHDKEIKTGRDLQVAVSSTMLNSEREVGLLRNGKSMTLKCKIIANKGEDSEQQSNDQSLVVNGVKFVDLTPDLVKKYNITSANNNGLFVLEVSPNSSWGRYGLKMGLRPRDIILSVKRDDNKKDISVKTLREIVTNIKHNEIFFTVQRGDRMLYIALPNINK
ncbi:DegP-like serine protease TSA47 [Orientia tsutsugamushi]|uniref:DegP-like serine protease TSA47 n=1 Tax=Orientia tsutsugamushi TaxID=784 RepID=UPI0035281EBC